MPGVMRRVVVTGIGCLSPNGNGREAFARALREGRSGVGRISLFDPEGLPTTIAGELKGFEPAAHLSAKDARHVSRAVPMAIAASAEALSDAGIDAASLTLSQRRELGVVLGTGGGPIEFSERMYHLYYTNKVKKASVYSIASGTIGTLSSEISMQFNLRGPSHVVSTGCASSTDALGYAFRSIKFGTDDVLLCGGVDATVMRGIMEGFGMMRTSRPAGRAIRRAPPAPSPPIGTASFSARGPGCSSWRSPTAPGPGARRSTAKSGATARPATRTTGSGWTRRGRSRRARCPSR
jgi:3-oxoacyl-[acyl-carrier-protein] synthase II